MARTGRTRTRSAADRRPLDLEDSIILILRPKLHELVTTEESRTLKQLEALGVEPDATNPTRTTVALSVPTTATPSQHLLGRALLDYLLRLDPLVAEIQVDGLASADIRELAARIPLEVVNHGSPADYVVAIGHAAAVDLIVDASGWVAGIGGAIDREENGIFNPIGPLAGAALAAGEVFKALFGLNYPDASYSRRFVKTAGAFSFYDYQVEGENPLLDQIAIDAHMVGLGGVGAGVIRVLGELGANVIGYLRLIDPDSLTTDGLNRVTYARWKSAVEKRQKVTEASEYLQARHVGLSIESHPDPFAVFKRGLAPRRQDRHYNTVITGLDDDDIRHEVQRDLPRLLIDAATGRDANTTVECVRLGEWGCLGCTRQTNDRGRIAEDDEECDFLPDERAPSLSFVSGFAGTLAAGELIKDAIGSQASLRGSFNHVFIYGLNPDLRSEAAQTASCRINCSSSSVLRAYGTKYGIRDALPSANTTCC